MKEVEDFMNGEKKEEEDEDDYDYEDDQFEELTDKRVSNLQEPQMLIQKEDKNPLSPVRETSQQNSSQIYNEEVQLPMLQ